MDLTLGVDVGGTKIAAGVVTPAGEIVARDRVETPAESASAVRAAIVDLVRRLRETNDVKAVGIGAAGFVSADRATVLFAPNLAWRDEPLRAVVEAAVDLPTIVENDANAAAWGEFRFGAGADVDDLMMVAVGTGLGGGVIVNGEVIRGTFGVAAEIGHMRVVPGGVLCGCGQLGCWEQYASGRALEREARRRATEERAAGAGLLGVAGGDVGRIDGRMVTRLAEDGDPFCIDLLDWLGRWLGEGIASLAAVLDPGVVLVGGGVSTAGDLVMEPMQRAFSEHLPAAGNHPELELRVATLGNDAGIIGAADLARYPAGEVAAPTVTAGAAGLRGGSPAAGGEVS